MQLRCCTASAYIAGEAFQPKTHHEQILQEFEVNIMDDVTLRSEASRPKTSKFAGPKTRTEIHQIVDQFAGVEQHDNSRMLDSLLLESPVYSHRSIGRPRRMLRRLHRSQSMPERDFSPQLGMKKQELQSPTDFDHNALTTELSWEGGSNDPAIQGTSAAGLTFMHDIVGSFTRMGSMDQQSDSDMIKRNKQRSDALFKTLFDSTVPPKIIREAFQLLKKSDKKRFIWMTEATEGFLDSDEEDALHKEVDRITEVQEYALEHFSTEDWWSKKAARLFNQLALHITQAEQAYMLLFNVLSLGLPMGVITEADPKITPEHIAKSLVSLKTATRNIDLDKVVEEAHACIKPFRLLLTPKGRRENKDEATGEIRMSTLIASSSTFRNAILEMDVDKTLCLVMKSKLSEIFDEAQVRVFIRNSRRETVPKAHVLHDDNKVDDHKYMTLIVSGEVVVVRTLDEVLSFSFSCFGHHFASLDLIFFLSTFLSTVA